MSFRRNWGPGLKGWGLSTAKKAGIQIDLENNWIPTFGGMTMR